MKKERQFQLEVDWIKALPGGVEPQVVLVSCAGKGSDVTPNPLDLEKVVEFKRRGEDLLRLSGLGYTIIRPGALVSEPGGYKALVFDQGGRITESIGAADVADICLRSLHEPAARRELILSLTSLSLVTLTLSIHLILPLFDMQEQDI